MKKYYSLQEVSQKASKTYGALFNEKLFREQLCYFKDINE